MTEFVKDGDPSPNPVHVQRVERGFWPKIKRIMKKGAARVPFLDDAIAMYYCAIDPTTPVKVKAVLFAALAYFVMPADMIPDVLAVVGFTDDATVLLTALNLVGAHVKPTHREKAHDVLSHPEEVPEGGPQDRVNT